MEEYIENNYLGKPREKHRYPLRAGHLGICQAKEIPASEEQRNEEGYKAHGSNQKHNAQKRLDHGFIDTGTEQDTVQVFKVELAPILTNSCS